MILILLNCSVCKKEEKNETKNDVKLVLLSNKNTVNIKYKKNDDIFDIDFNKDLISDENIISKEDRYLIAKIVMAEAEGCSDKTKQYVAQVILNRVKDKNFADTVYDVIFQHNNNIYQFSSIPNGRWDKVKPNEECFKAVDVVLANIEKEDITNGALYFESCDNKDNWHNNNLTLLYEIKGENMRFYK